VLGELLSDLRYRLRALLWRADLERDLDDELRFHVEHEAEKYMRAGLSPDEAGRRARLVFGGIEYAKEESRDARGTAWLDALMQDVRYAARSLRRHRAFSLTVVLTLALGIGANTAIFTLIDALLLRALPVPNAEQLVTIGDPAAVNEGWTGSPMTDYVSYPLYRDVRDHNDVLSGLYANGAAGDLDVVIGTDRGAAPEHPVTRFVSGNFFTVLELPAYAGRTFGADDDRPSGTIAVISYAYWQRRFARERAAIGSIIHVQDVAITIVGVLGPSLTNTMVAIGIVYAPTFARIARGSTLGVSNLDHIVASRTIGAGNARIIAQHVLPNIAAPLIIQTTLALSTAILIEATLSFLGLGTQPPMPSWGTMLGTGRRYMELAPWVAIYPGIAIMIAVLGFNLAGDGLRDALDPRLREA